ncbi:MAG: peptidoglycan editing factor PgeF [Pseudomonadota bacterium]
MTRSIVSDVLAETPGVRHGYFTRLGGVSQGLYGSLNVGRGSNDNHDHVERNRALIADDLGVSADRLYLPYQIHSALVVEAETDFAEKPPQADAVVTARPGRAVGVSTADCGPVLFADGRNRVIGAAHAGWKGAISGVLEATLEAMADLGAVRDQIVAVLGPTISGSNYEVGPEFVDRFVTADPKNGVFFVPVADTSARPGHAWFDLPAYIVARLDRAGIRQAIALDHCTYADEERFFSYRRSVHRNEPDYGRLLSAIVLEE